MSNTTEPETIEDSPIEKKLTALRESETNAKAQLEKLQEHQKQVQTDFQNAQNQLVTAIVKARGAIEALETLVEKDA